MVLMFISLLVMVKMVVMFIQYRNFSKLLRGGLNREGGSVSTKSLILFYLWTDLILNKIQKHTSVVTTELW